MSNSDVSFAQTPINQRMNLNELMDNNKNWKNPGKQVWVGSVFAYCRMADVTVVILWNGGVQVRVTGFRDRLSRRDYPANSFANLFIESNNEVVMR